ncbi:transcription factor bHLH [Forsythia ovata]|uniref:Transcription factor bHLH n=1 Tax=Forsythia ovata TaxID=205694 RepID=A0ABD1R3V1_9LAMI
MNKGVDTQNDAWKSEGSTCSPHASVFISSSFSNLNPLKEIPESILLKHTDSSFKTHIAQGGQELQMNSGIAPVVKSGMAEEKSPSRVHSSKKKQGQVPKRIHKAEREKMKREYLNDRFLALANSLELSDQTNGKAFLLNEATRVVTETLAQIKSLKRENVALLSESQYIIMEKKELQDENSALEAQIGNLQSELKGRVSESQLDLNMAPPESNLQAIASHTSNDHPGFPSMQPGQQQVQTVNPLYLVPICSNLPAYVEPSTAQLGSKPSKPHARYPTPADTWPSQLLEKQPELEKENQQSDRNNGDGC